MRFPDGSVRWLFGSASPEPQEDSCILWHGFITDITKRKEAQQSRALLQAHLQQSQKVESIGRLAGGVAHDFNNLLTSILRFSELALQELPPESAAALYLTRVVETANRGASLTQQLLAFARKKIIKPERVDLNVVTQGLLPMIERLIGADIELALAEPLPCTMIDVCSIEQVLINLVVNARDAMPDGGRLLIETGQVTLDSGYARRFTDMAPGDYVMVSVTDSGCGMHAEVLERVFEPFFTTKAAGQGTGLGLATCYGIVRQAAGHIHVYSEPGMGASFKVYLPLVDGAAECTVREQEATFGATLPVCRETVLVVEDDPAILQLSTAALGNLGYQVLAAANGACALELAAAHAGPVDQLFTDIVMPKLGGRELMAQLSAMHQGMKVLYTSGYSEDAVVTRGMLQPGIDFLQKPYSLQVMANRVRAALDRN